MFDEASDTTYAYYDGADELTMRVAVMSRTTMYTKCRYPRGSSVDPNESSVAVLVFILSFLVDWNGSFK